MVPGLALHPTGALLYQPFLTGPAPAAPPATGIQGGVDILDAHTSGLTIIQLANVSLSIGTVSPASAPAAGGTTLTLRGSGFQSGATVTISGKSATTNFVDMNTLTVTTPLLTAGPQQGLVTNPSGDFYALDAAFTAN